MDILQARDETDGQRPTLKEHTDEEERDWHGMSTSSPVGGTERATTPSVPRTISESGSHSPRTLCALCTRMTSNKQTVTKRKKSDDFKTHRISKIVHVDVLFVVCFLASHRVVSFGAHKQSRVVEVKRGRCEGHPLVPPPPTQSHRVLLCCDVF